MLVESLIWKAVLDVIGIKVLGVDLNHLTSSQSNLHSLFSATTQQSLVSHIFQYFSGYLPLRHLVPAKFNRQFFNDCESVRRIIRDHVSRGDPNRKMGDDYVEEEGATQDLILTLIEKGNMSQDEVVEYVLNLMVLGHDTTACSLAWAVHRLTQNPACQDRLRSEIHKFNNQAAAPTYGEVEGLKYLDNFLKEVLRLHCPCESPALSLPRLYRSIC